MEDLPSPPASCRTIFSSISAFGLLKCPRSALPSRPGRGAQTVWLQQLQYGPPASWDGPPSVCDSWGASHIPQFQQRHWPACSLPPDSGRMARNFEHSPIHGVSWLISIFHGGPYIKCAGRMRPVHGSARWSKPMVCRLCSCNLVRGSAGPCGAPHGTAKPRMMIVMARFCLIRKYFRQGAAGPRALFACAAKTEAALAGRGILQSRGPYTSRPYNAFKRDTATYTMVVPYIDKHCRQPELDPDEEIIFIVRTHGWPGRKGEHPDPLCLTSKRIWMAGRSYLHGEITEVGFSEYVYQQFTMITKALKVRSVLIHGRKNITGLLEKYPFYKSESAFVECDPKKIMLPPEIAEHPYLRNRLWAAPHRRGPPGGIPAGGPAEDAGIRPGNAALQQPRGRRSWNIFGRNRGATMKIPHMETACEKPPLLYSNEAIMFMVSTYTAPSIFGINLKMMLCFTNIRTRLWTWDYFHCDMKAMGFSEDEPKELILIPKKDDVKRLYIRNKKIVLPVIEKYPFYKHNPLG
ncbi:hypothetical protein CENSYa_0633 [Cenarchaeum symbiosum A]|uniref:Uncharacterized protein n=1 Tax=Cenarchaeum symbiosum (strain A) TaxID=414004 RepID=A0RV99_CENSY|nr:hypothetical protein CENSYa_0633 [Cenarchaeum symbiosum A]